jgi:hypothetical protein
MALFGIIRMTMIMTQRQCHAQPPCCAPKHEVKTPQAVPHQQHQQPVWLTASLLWLTQVRNVYTGLVHARCAAAQQANYCRKGQQLLAARACSTCLVTRTVSDRLMPLLAQKFLRSSRRVQAVA